MVPSPSDKVAVFLHSGDYDRMHQGLAIAAAAAAAGRRVEVFLFWWALERCAKGELDEPEFSPPREEISHRFETVGAPTLRQLLAHARESGQCTLYACTGSVSTLGVQPPEIEGLVDRFVGWSSILKLTAGVVDRFYL